LQEALMATQWTRLAKEAEALYDGTSGASLATSVVDLGCGTAELSKEVAALYEGSAESPQIVSVDAVCLAPDVVAANLACLPEGWSGRFHAAVLCRSLWARDYPRVLAEAKRVLQDSHHSCLIVVEPFLRWWGRSRRWPEKNALVIALQRSGFCIDWQLSSNTEPRASATGLEYAVFQYIVAYVEPKKCVICRELDAHRYQHGLHLCINCEEVDAGMRQAPRDEHTQRRDVSITKDLSPPKCRRDDHIHGHTSDDGFKWGRMGPWDAKGFAFISPDGGGKDVFCHVSSLAPGKKVKEGETCSFRIVPNERWWSTKKSSKVRAADVMPVSMERPRTHASRSRTPLRQSRRHQHHGQRFHTPRHRRGQGRSRTPRHHGHGSRATPCHRGRW